MPKKARVSSREMKLAAVRRMMAGERVSALARELKLRRHLLYLWRDNFRAGGPSALRTRGWLGKSVVLAKAPVVATGPQFRCLTDGVQSKIFVSG